MPGSWRGGAAPLAAGGGGGSGGSPGGGAWGGVGGVGCGCPPPPTSLQWTSTLHRALFLLVARTYISLCVCGAGGQAMAGEVLLHQRCLAGRGSAQALGFRARPAQFRLCGPPVDVPAVRAIAAVCASCSHLSQL